MTLPRLSPMLATTAPLPDDRSGDDWAFEVKWDGVRALAYIEDGRFHLESRNRNDITGRYPELWPLAAELGGAAVILDGEVVAFDDAGRPSFGHLQARMHLANEREVAVRMGDVPVTFMVFDVLHLGDHDATPLPWNDRRRLLEGLEVAGPSWQTVPVHTGAGAGPALSEASRAAALEGVVAKRRSSTYAPGRRTRDWLKVKHLLRQEVVVGAWVGGEGGRSGRIGALVCGVYEDDGVTLRHVGKVGTGFTDAELNRLAGVLEPLRRDKSPFADEVPWKGAHFVEPVVVIDVEFTEWTQHDTMRHPSYKGQRDDKEARSVRREPAD